MKRRDNIKLMISGGIGASLLLNTESCKTENNDINIATTKSYGRTEEEKTFDAKLYAETFFTKEEMTTITLLSDIIVPADEKSGNASAAGVPAFIEFIVKDQPRHQLPLRGGIKWLDNQCNALFAKPFAACDTKQQIQIIDLIAYPDKAEPKMMPGVKFFNLMRDLTLTGFYTSEMGIKDLGYVGNRPNEWDGVSDEILKKHGFEYDKKTLDTCLKVKDRNTVVKWDDEGNIIG